MIAQNVKVTTTSGFDNIRIEEYLEPVTAHVVVGMNFFKDLFAGLTDIFGGKSRTYQNTLSSINEEVINELRKKAISIGGNCILSLKIDNDEVSAQGKSMMMVSAIGTVAIANFSKKDQSQAKSNPSNLNKLNKINHEHFNILKTKKKYINDSLKNSIKMDESFRSFVLKNNVHELANIILERFIQYSDSCVEYYSEEQKSFPDFIHEYFLTIDSNISTKLLFSKLHEKLTPEVRIAIANLVKDLKLIDYTEVISLLRDSNIQVQKTGIMLSISEKNSFEKADIQHISELKKIISNSFPQRGEKTTKKKVLSSKLIDIWICKCGEENNINNVYCSDCYMNIYGFLEKETNPIVAIKILEEMLEILKEILD